MSQTKVFNDSNLDVAKNIPKSWMLRRCDSYYEEYRQCKSLKGKLYQLYVDGKVDADKCQSWSDNFEDCKLWTKNADTEAATRIIQREDERIKARLRGHFGNDVWQRRESPPDDWNKPLPKHLSDLSENSMLAAYQENGNQLPSDYELKHVNNRLKMALPSCSIM